MSPTTGVQDSLSYICWFTKFRWAIQSFTVFFLPLDRPPYKFSKLISTNVRKDILGDMRVWIESCGDSQ